MDQRAPRPFHRLVGGDIDGAVASLSPPTDIGIGVDPRSSRCAQQLQKDRCRVAVCDMQSPSALRQRLVQVVESMHECRPPKRSGVVEKRRLEDHQRDYPVVRMCRCSPRRVVIESQVATEPDNPRTHPVILGIRAQVWMRS